MKKADNFILKDQDGKDFELYKNLDKHNLLAFYPKDNSFVCSRQMKNYSDSRTQFEKAGIRLIGINDGLPEEHSFFCSSSGLNITLLSDPERKVSAYFGALYPFGIVKRKLVLLNKNAEIVFDKVLLQFTYWDNEKILSYIAENEIF